MNILERFARQFIYKTGYEALKRAHALMERGIYSTINHTIEDVNDSRIVKFAMVHIIHLLTDIRDWGLADFTSVSIKMSALGMNIDKQQCEKQLLRIIKFAKHYGVEVQFDVEGPETHEFYYRMVHSYNLNGAIQAKSPPILLPSKPPRIVKGAYKVKLHKGRVEVFWQMLEWVKEYLQTWDEVVIVGTHDPTIIESLIAHKDRIELQYLHGVKEKEFLKYKEMGFKVREYIPYGDNWYPYLKRRIKEDPWGKFKLFWRRK